MRSVLTGSIIACVLLAVGVLLLPWAERADAALVPPVGDADCNEIVTATDAGLVLQFDAGLTGPVPCPERADVDDDGAVNSVDAALILQYDVGFKANCPPGKGETGSGLGASLTVDRDDATYLEGMPIKLILSITNCESEPVTRRYSSSQIYDFEAVEANGVVIWRWSDDWGFAGIISEGTLLPGETVTFTETWDQQTRDDEQVDPGQYDVRGYDVGCSDITPRQCNLAGSLSIEIVSP